MGKIRLGMTLAAIVLGPSAGLAQPSTSDLQRALIGFKNHIQSGISYSEFPNAVASLTTEIELAERNKTLTPDALKALSLLKLDMTVMNMTWSLKFGPLGNPRSPFTFCQSEVGKMFASTGATFKEQGLLDADLKTEDLSGQCAYYNDQTIGQLLSAVARQADKSLDALAVPQKPVRKRRG